MRTMIGILAVFGLGLSTVAVLAASPGDLIINELMQDPAAVGDSQGEWFELYNNTTSDIDINGWVIRDDAANVHTIDNGAPLLVPAKGYLVLGNNADLATNGGYQCDYEYSGFTLSNSDDEIVLEEEGLEIDRINYDGGPIWPDPTGASMGWLGPPGDNNDGTRWVIEGIASYGDGDWGTPGYKNTDSSLPVGLSSFTGSFSSGVIVLRWRTEVEVNNLGFYVWRALTEDGEYQSVSGLIPGHGSCLEPHDYLYRDENIILDNTHYYKLRQVDMQGGEVFYGPISVFAGATGVDQATWGKIKARYR
ncbi:lamin tail domain-containing protein [bacterium]|nr:lamin tail domain-containing protein [bacterium]